MRNFIQFFVTGGTFDKEYNFITGELYFRNTHLALMFDRGRCTLDIDIKTLMMLDSLEMTEEDRMIISHNCKRSKSDKIIITHGTDTITTTAATLAAENIPKTIVITGAMIPYAFGNSSDGFFNLGAAVAFVQTLPHGVYVAMNGRYFPWNNVKKNRKTGFFEEINV
jgi:L-asparaginase